VSAGEVDTAINELTARHLLRRLPDGQVYRASPAEYQVPLEGLAGLVSHVDPMGGDLTCRSRQVSARRVPEDIGRALGMAPGETVLVIKSVWLVGGEPGALSAAYLPQRLARLAGQVPGSGPVGGDLAGEAAGGDPAGGDLPSEAAGGGRGTAAGGDPAGVDLAGVDLAGVDLAGVDLAGVDLAGVDLAGVDPEVDSGGGNEPAGDSGGGNEPPGQHHTASAGDRLPVALARAIQIELGPPPPSVARSLRLSAGQSVATVTVRFEDPAGSSPVALTMAMLRPDLFRIVVQAPETAQPAPGGDGFASAWTHAAEGWEP
jgi:hypothetical protein